MVFKKHKWISYGRQNGVVEITIYDENNKKLDFFKSNNKQGDQSIGKILKEKYGRDFSPEISRESSINNKKTQHEEDIKKEIEWLGYSN